MAVYIINLKFFTPGALYGFGYGVNEGILPAGAVRFIKHADPSGDMSNPGRMGGYIAYHLYPERKIFVYNEPNIYAKVMRMTEKGTIMQYPVDYAFYPKENVQYALETAGSWTLVFWDDAATVVVRNASGNWPIAKKYGIKYFTPWTVAQKPWESEPSSEKRLVFAREMSQCLSFSRNDRLASVLTGLLSRLGGHVTPDEGRALTEAALRYNSESAPLLALHGFYNYRIKKLDVAEKFLKKAVFVDNSLTIAHLNLAYIAYDRGDYKTAVELFKKTVSLDKENAEAYYGLGLAYIKTGQTALAEENLKTYLEMKPSGPWAKKAAKLIESL